MNDKKLIGKNLYIIHYANKLISGWEVYEIKYIEARGFGVFRFYLNSIVGTRSTLDLALRHNLNSLKSIICHFRQFKLLRITTSKKAFENFIKTHTMV